MRAYFFTAVGFLPSILLALFCFGVIGLALGAMSRRLSGTGTRNRWAETIPGTAQELTDAPDRREARAWVGEEVPELYAIKSPDGAQFSRNTYAELPVPGIPFPHPDQARIEALEDWCLGGCVDMGVEIDGGVYITVSMIGGPHIELREQNCIRDAIDAARKLMEIAP